MGWVFFAVLFLCFLVVVICGFFLLFSFSISLVAGFTSAFWQQAPHVKPILGLIRFSDYRLDKPWAGRDRL
jgi:hypothetical protein